MKSVYRIVRSLLVIVLVLLFATPIAIYICLSLPSVQHSAGRRIENELTLLLGTEVSIGKVDIVPFNRVVLRNVSILDERGDTVLSVGHLGAGISIYESIWNGRLTVTYAELIDVELKLYRDSLSAPLNIDPIIARFKSKERKEPSEFDLSVNMVVLRNSSLHYDVLSESHSYGKFDPNHIHVYDLRADLRAPRISSEELDVDVKRMGLSEASGFVLTDFSADIHMDRSKLDINDLSVSLPESYVSFDNIRLLSPMNDKFSPKHIITRIATLPDSYICPSDLVSFLPALSNINETVDMEIDIEGSLDRIVLSRLSLSVRDHDTWILLIGKVDGLDEDIKTVEFDLDRLHMNISIPVSISLLENCGAEGKRIADRLRPLAPLGDVNLLGSGGGSMGTLDFDGSILTDCGNIDLDFGINKKGKNSPWLVDGRISTDAFGFSEFSGGVSSITDMELNAEADLSIAPEGNINGLVDIIIPSLQWKGYAYSDISVKAAFANRHVELEAESRSSSLDFTFKGGRDLVKDDPATEFFANIRNVDIGPFLNKSTHIAENILSGRVEASVHGATPDDLIGWARCEELDMMIDGRRLYLPEVLLDVDRKDSIRVLSLNSDPVDAVLEGRYTYSGLAEDVRGILSDVLPSLLHQGSEISGHGTDAVLSVVVKPDTTLSRFFRLPVDFIYPVELRSAADASAHTISLHLDAPYLKHKDKLVENTSLSMLLDGYGKSGMVSGGSKIPTKSGQMDLKLDMGLMTDSIRSSVSWDIAREKDFHGSVDFSASFGRDMPDNTLHTVLRFMPSQLVFNDSAWTVNSSVVDIRPGRIEVDGFGGGRRGQKLRIDGVASADSLDRMIVSLDRIDLDYLFETLAISDAVMFGGRATGILYGEGLLSESPGLYTPRLNVDGLAYNNCVMGDGDIRSYWDNNTKKITINADINQSNGRKSLINGYIKPFTEELDFRFSAENAPVGFMLPFMSAFTSSISGEVSGNAHLFGTFKDLDMSGDIFVKDLSMKLDFTNTTYTVTDSVHITPGLISFNDVNLKDRYGNQAILSGKVTHDYFHDPTFSFDISNANNLLVYDIGENDTDDPWYGRIFGRGGATVKGVPGRIDIGVTMRTEPKSTFTFVLSDSENSEEYDFITLRDRDQHKKDSIASLDPTPFIVKQLRERIRQQTTGDPTVYAMEFNVDITPEATLILIMDPIGGDRITAHGTGHLRMNYSSDGELEMYGEYTLSRGSYNFTLQDIIVKDFTILEGSKITFLGDPYAAQLNIKAAYSVNANLSDLDESFLEDRELARTNVRVNALMLVKGDMRQPDISFDLEFPTLTSDTYRKVRSIISTDEMMDQQIIYLLALDKFYTPDYMSTTHGNELVSMASSTLSSRLGSMLGQLSDNWSIAPAIRSDKGDFSDVEVDVALSSHLLDNRLLLNGNLGYRDKSLNNNSFIGDFDIRYLLNRAGTIQLKAYNRYNDQNYYLKSALTTQGVGIVFKRDFDNIFSFLKRHSKKTKVADSKKNDGNFENPGDTLNVNPHERIDTVNDFIIIH